MLYVERGVNAGECARALNRPYPSVKGKIQSHGFLAGKRPSALDGIALPPIQLAAQASEPEPVRDPIEVERERQEAARLLTSLVRQGRIGQHKVSTREAYVWLIDRL